MNKLLRGRYLTNMLLALLGVVIALGVSELLARSFFPSASRMQFVPDPIVGFRHAPQQRVWWTNESREFGVWVTINSQGDPDIERLIDNKPDGVYRIAIIGDSMVEAAQVRREERFTSLLEQKLNAWIRTVPSSIQQVEVLNFGTASYGTAQEWLYYKSHARRYDPDLVLLVFLPGNDIINNSYQLEVVRSDRSEIMPFFNLNDVGELSLKDNQFYINAVTKYTESTSSVGFFRQVYRSVRDQVRLIQILRQVYLSIRARANGEGALSGQIDLQTKVNLELFDPQVQQTSDDWQQAWAITGAILAQFAQDVANDSAEFHVAIATGPWEIHKEARDLVLNEFDTGIEYDWELSHQLTETMLKQQGVSYTNLLPAIKAAASYNTAEPMHFIRDGHYTPLGHQIVAAELLPVLQGYMSVE